MNNLTFADSKSRNTTKTWQLIYMFLIGAISLTTYAQEHVHANSQDVAASSTFGNWATSHFWSPDDEWKAAKIITNHGLELHANYDKDAVGFDEISMWASGVQTARFNKFGTSVVGHSFTVSSYGSTRHLKFNMRQSDHTGISSPNELRFAGPSYKFLDAAGKTSHLDVSPELAQITSNNIRMNGQTFLKKGLEVKTEFKVNNVDLGATMISVFDDKLFARNIYFSDDSEIENDEESFIKTNKSTGLKYESDKAHVLSVEETDIVDVSIDDVQINANVRVSGLGSELIFTNPWDKNYENHPKDHESNISIYPKWETTDPTGKDHNQWYNALMVDLGTVYKNKFKITNVSGANLLFVESTRLDNPARVGINTNKPSEALHVIGKVKAHSFITDGTVFQGNNAATFPDYVFEKDYKLMPLKDMERFVTQNKHLPGMPTQAEVAKNGLNLTEVSITTVEKVEELLLHIIQLEKRIAELETKTE